MIFSRSQSLRLYFSLMRYKADTNDPSLLPPPGTFQEPDFSNLFNHNQIFKVDIFRSN